ncbi:hypothetical protein K1T71_014150 [Dendrolimus kikuchii]|uniref:Uncharacterized protein n=1 Tax=Dendrolimus kikuchii TaxID=765133 RepID=A0ACC1CF66_9NEOP|nr:hypothetical protein K1T71_014150 [Dendrolimus kikuchii]
MADVYTLFYFLLCLFTIVQSSDILCEEGFCREYLLDTGCTSPAEECRINNATHNGMWMQSPTLCSCCEFCLPFYGDNEYCSTGGPGLGTTVGRCSDGLTCVADANDGHSYCTRMQSQCHSDQDDYDHRLMRGKVGALEERPQCDGKGNYAAFSCVPAHTCFCQSEDGERIFGEVLYIGTATSRNMHCGCSRLHEAIKKSIGQGVPLPVIGPRCTSDGNFYPIQCIGRTCYCVDRVTGLIVNGERENVDLDEAPITELNCYDSALDLFPHLSQGEPPYNFTTPCYESAQSTIDFILESKEEGFIVDYFTSFPECMPDGTFGRVTITANRSKICVDERGRRIDDYEALPNTPQYHSMDCKCAQTSLIMASSTEQPVCCSNGNFRSVQCRRGVCRCVDSDGRQIGTENADVTRLPCYKPDWRTC